MCLDVVVVGARPKAPTGWLRFRPACCCAPRSCGAPPVGPGPRPLGRGPGRRGGGPPRRRSRDPGGRLSWSVGPSPRFGAGLFGPVAVVDDQRRRGYGHLPGVVLLAVAKTGVALGTLATLGSAPVFCGLLARALLGEGLRASWAVATALAVAGCGLLLLPRRRRLGVAYRCAARPGGRGCARDVHGLGPGAAASGGGHRRPARRHAHNRRLPPRPRSRRWCRSSAQRAGAVLVGWLGPVATAVAYVIFARGLAGVPAGMAATLGLAEPLAAAILGVGLLGEHLSPVAGLGGGLLVLGLAGSVLRLSRADRARWPGVGPHGRELGPDGRALGPMAGLCRWPGFGARWPGFGARWPRIWEQPTKAGEIAERPDQPVGAHLPGSRPKFHYRPVDDNGSGALTGRLGRVTVPIPQGGPGEVVVSIRGGTERFAAWCETPVAKHTRL